MSNAEVLVPIAAITFLFGGPVAAFIIWRVFAHQERMEMIRRGVMPPMGDGFRYRDARGSYTSWPGAASGADIPPPGAVPPPFYATDPSFYAQRRLRKGITVSMIGLALLIGMSFITPGHLGGQLLVGFIVLFVGIAQVINALMCGAQFPSMGQAHPGSTNFGDPSNFGNASNFGPPPNSATPPPPPTGPYGWRPDGTPEIQKPVSPPDQR